MSKHHYQLQRVEKLNTYKDYCRRWRINYKEKRETERERDRTKLHLNFLRQ